MGIISQPILPLINMVVPSIMLMIAIRKFRDTLNHGQLKFGTGFLLGFIICLGTGTVFGVFRYFEYTLFPELGEQLSMTSQQRLAESSLPQDRVELWSKAYRLAYTPAFRAISTVFSFIFWGSILSLILAAAFKRENSTTPINSN
jgi:hypothetical protein